MRQVQICEVGPRDGLQNAKQLMPTETKKAWISALAAAGLNEIEVGSFVPPKLIPAMADTAEIVKHALSIKGLKVVALAPNVKGFERAREAGAHKITFPVSASHQHSVSNVRMTPDQMVEEVRKAAWMRRGKAPEIEGAVSTAFGCTMQGNVPEDDVVRIAVQLAEFCDGVALADTFGYAVLLEGEIVGYAQWWEDTQPLYRHAGIDLFLDPAVHGRGLGTETLRVLCAHLIDEHGFHRLVIDPEVENEAAIASFRKVGFKPVGVMRRYIREAPGEWKDGLLMDLLAEELARD